MSARVVRAVARVVVVAGALALAGGCYTLRAKLPGTVRDDVREHVVVIGTIDEVVTHTYYLGGLLNPPPEEVFHELLLARVRAAGGDGVANLVFESHFEPGDVLLRYGTLGVVAPRTYRLRADIVRIDAAPIPGHPLLDEGGR